MVKMVSQTLKNLETGIRVAKQSAGKALFRFYEQRILRDYTWNMFVKNLKI